MIERIIEVPKMEIEDTGARAKVPPNTSMCVIICIIIIIIIIPIVIVIITIIIMIIIIIISSSSSSSSSNIMITLIIITNTKYQGPSSSGCTVDEAERVPAAVPAHGVHGSLRSGEGGIIGEERFKVQLPLPAFLFSMPNAWDPRRSHAGGAPPKLLLLESEPRARPRASRGRRRRRRGLARKRTDRPRARKKDPCSAPA